MKYHIRQVTTYRYGAVVPYARHLLRLTPVSRLGQEVISSSICVEPAPYERRDAFDFFGNRVTHVGIEMAHDVFEVVSRAEVALPPEHPIDPSVTPPWEDVRAVAAVSGNLAALSPVHQIFPSRLVPLDAAIGAYARQSFPAGRPILDGAMDLMGRIHEEFTYDPSATDSTTPVSDAFAMRRGVCQDFAHVMIAGLRTLGMPAAYVSGYLRTEPPSGQPRLAGADATHAWVAVWCGEEHGWQGLDPTNAVATGASHIVLAFGRDFADVSPLDGVILVGGGHTLGVSVDVVPYEEEAQA